MTRGHFALLLIIAAFAAATARAEPPTAPALDASCRAVAADASPACVHLASVEILWRLGADRSPGRIGWLASACTGGRTVMVRWIAGSVLAVAVCGCSGSDSQPVAAMTTAGAGGTASSTMAMPIQSTPSQTGGAAGASARSGSVAPPSNGLAPAGASGGTSTPAASGGAGAIPNAGANAADGGAGVCTSSTCTSPWATSSTWLASKPLRSRRILDRNARNSAARTRRVVRGGWWVTSDSRAIYAMQTRVQVQRSDRSTTTSLTWSTGAMSV
jgi:hypothetical protein